MREVPGNSKYISDFLSVLLKVLKSFNSTMYEEQANFISFKDLVKLLRQKYLDISPHSNPQIIHLMRVFPTQQGLVKTRILNDFGA